MDLELVKKLEEYFCSLSEKENNAIIKESTKYIIKNLEKEKQLT